MSEAGGSIASAIGYENMLEQLKEQAISKIGGDKLAKANAVISQLSQANMLLNHYDFYKKLAGALNEKAEGVSKAVKSKIGETLGTGDGEEGGIMEALTGLKQQAEEKVGQLTKLSSKAQAFIKDPEQALTQAVLDNLGIKAEDGTELTDYISSQVSNFKAQAEGFSDFVNASQPIKDRLDELQKSRGDLEDAFNQRKSELRQEQSNIEDRYADYVNDLFDRENRLPTPQELAPWQREADGLLQEADSVKQQFLQDDGNLVDEINDNQGRLEQIGKSIFSGIDGYNPEEGIFANLGNLDKPTLSTLFNPEQLTRFEGISPYLGTFTDKSFIEKASQLVQSPVRELSADVAGNPAKAFSENADKLVKGATEDATEQFNAIRSGVTENFNNAKAEVEEQIEGATQKYQEGVEAVSQMRDNATQLINQGQQAVNDAKTALTEGLEEGTSFAQKGEQLAEGLKAGGQALGKTIGGATGEAIEAGGEAIGSAIPLVGEVIDAGLIISQLVTGIADIFRSKAHTQPQVVQATEQYGI
jgi:hypothetical protein